MAEQELEILKIKAKAFDILERELDFNGDIYFAYVGGGYVGAKLYLNDAELEILNKAVKLYDLR